MLKAKVAVLVSGGGTNLQALIDHWQAGNLTCGELALVIASKPGVFALERAAKAGIETMVFEKKAYADGNAWEAAMLDALKTRNIDLIVLAGFLSILSETFIKEYPGRIVNVHPSLIPSFCGAGFYGLKVHEAALHYGVKVTGATVHLVNEVPDGGKILLQKAVDVLPGDTPEILQRRVMEEAEWILLPRAVSMLCDQIVAFKAGGKQ